MAKVENIREPINLYIYFFWIYFFSILNVTWTSNVRWLFSRQFYFRIWKYFLHCVLDSFIELCPCSGVARLISSPASGSARGCSRSFKSLSNEYSIQREVGFRLIDRDSSSSSSSSWTSRQLNSIICQQPRIRSLTFQQVLVVFEFELKREEEKMKFNFTYNWYSFHTNIISRIKNGEEEKKRKLLWLRDNNLIHHRKFYFFCASLYSTALFTFYQA